MNGRLKLVVVDPNGLGAACRGALRAEFEAAWSPASVEPGRFINAQAPDVVLLFDGHREGLVEHCVALRQTAKLRRLGVLTLVPAGQVEQALERLGAGADDCLDWPCDPRVVCAHVRAVARRREAPAAKQALRRGPLQLDAASGAIRIDGEVVALTRKEFEILAMLFERRGWVVRRAALLERMRGPSGDAFSHALDTHVSNLRRKLGRLGTKLSAVKGVGYRLDA